MSFFGRYVVQRSLPSGDRYDGECVESLWDGHGRYEGTSGDCYTGSWSAGKRHGLGRWTSPDGSEYVRRQ